MLLLLPSNDATEFGWFWWRRYDHDVWNKPLWIHLLPLGYHHTLNSNLFWSLMYRKDALNLISYCSWTFYFKDIHGKWQKHKWLVHAPNLFINQCEVKCKISFFFSTPSFFKSIIPKSRNQIKILLGCLIPNPLMSSSVLTTVRWLLVCTLCTDWFRLPPIPQCTAWLGLPAAGGCCSHRSVLPRL